MLLDPERAIVEAYGFGAKGAERYLTNPEGGRRPAVIIGEDGRVLKVLPDLMTVDQQQEALGSLS